MNRSILENPKQEKQASTNLGLEDGLITQIWRTRLRKFYRTQIPSHIPLENQIWLTNPREIVDFNNRLNDGSEDLSNKIGRAHV